MKLRSLLSPGALDEMAEIACACPAGCFVEVGVYQGGSAQRLLEVASRQGRGLYLYDTFTGIPHRDACDVHAVGDFGDVDAAQVRAALPGATVVEGVFPQSMVVMPPVAFAHLDCDQYRSIVESVEALGPLLVDGGSILFDDYNALDGATAAVHDLFGKAAIEVTRCGKALWTKRGGLRWHSPLRN